MTHIVTDAQSNPKLKQIYQILLLAGYFRIRIGSLKPFDKVIGGLAWCISCSNFDVDVEYNDQMQIGQKIKVGEKICDALKNMKCPFNIQPFQLQGLDVNAIYPLVQWLIKFVYETREVRQKFNTRLSDFLGKGIITQEAQNAPRTVTIESRRIKKNAQSQQMSKSDPLRVYSALLQFDDATSASTYNKLCGISGGKLAGSSKNKEKHGEIKGSKASQFQSQSGDKGEFDLSTYLFETSGDRSQGNIQTMLEIGSEQRKKFQQIQGGKLTISGQQLSKIVTQNRDKIEQVLKQAEIEDQDSPEAKVAKALQAQNDAFENQKKLLEQKSKAIDSKRQRLAKKVEHVREALKEAVERVNSQETHLQEYKEAKTQFVQELKAKNLKEKETKVLQKMVQERTKLKAKRQEVKRSALAQIQQLNKAKAKAQLNLPEIDEQVYAKMLEEMKKKKRIRDEKFVELADLNQELSVFQRKIQKITSPPEVAQYHKRLTEIYESINLQIQQRKDLLSQHQQSQGVCKIASDYLQLISNFKESYLNSKSKSQKKELIEALQANIGALEANQKSGNAIMKSVTENRKRNMEEYNDMVKLEKEYFKLRKELAMEIEVEAD